MNYFYAANGQQSGPIPEEQLIGMVTSGSLSPDTLVWAEGMAGWEPYSKVFAGGGAASGVVCSICRQVVPADDAIPNAGGYVCSNCKPKFVQGLREGASRGRGLALAGIGARFLADVVDTILLSVLQYGSAALMTSPGNMEGELIVTAIWMVIGIAYQVIFLGMRGQTIGKILLKIKVVNADGSNINYGKATGRTFAELLSGFTFGIGYIIAFFDSQKRTLHDRLAGTRVVDAKE